MEELEVVTARLASHNPHRTSVCFQCKKDKKNFGPAIWTLGESGGNLRRYCPKHMGFILSRYSTIRADDSLDRETSFWKNFFEVEILMKLKGIKISDV